jgi:hypothetical protein
MFREHDADVLLLPPVGHVLGLHQSLHLRLPQRVLCRGAALVRHQIHEKAALVDHSQGILFIYAYKTY